jgi:hypothetical protein
VGELSGELGADRLRRASSLLGDGRQDLLPGLAGDEDHCREAVGDGPFPIPAARRER